MNETLVVEPGMSPRRFYLLKFHALLLVESFAMAGVYRAKHDELTGSTPLPVGFPFLTLLQDNAYTAWEDFDGATLDEVCRNIGLGPMDAQAVLNGWKSLPVPGV